MLQLLAWSVETVASAVGATTFEYTEGSLAIDPADLDRVVVSKRVAGEWRIHLYVTSDAGASWAVTQLTSTGAPSIYPEYVNDHQPELEAMWLTGTFTTQSSYNAKIEGWGVPI